MYNIFQGEQFKVALLLRDDDNNPVSPNATIIKNIEVYITSRIDSKVYAKFSKIAKPEFITIPVENDMLMLKIPKDATIDSPVGQYDVTVKIIITQTGMPSNEGIIIRKGTIYELTEAIK